MATKDNEAPAPAPKLIAATPRVSVEYGPRSPDDLHYLKIEAWGGDPAKMRALAVKLATQLTDETK
jgi:hypothetical protein